MNFTFEESFFVNLRKMEYILYIIILNKKESLQFTDHNAGLCVLLTETH